MREGGVEQFALGYKKFEPQLLLYSSIRSLDLSTLELGLATYHNTSTPPIPARCGPIISLIYGSL